MDANHENSELANEVCNVNKLILWNKSCHEVTVKKTGTWLSKLKTVFHLMSSAQTSWYAQRHCVHRLLSFSCQASSRCHGGEVTFKTVRESGELINDLCKRCNNANCFSECKPH